MKFQAEVEEILPRTGNVKSFRFARPRDFFYQPGQWMFVTILVDGEWTIHHFTISSSPTEREFLEFTKKITDHPFSLALDRLRPKDPAFIDGPYGEFTFNGEHPKVGMITGGIGITPLRSMVRYCTDRSVSSQITLLCGNRNEESIVFREELEEMRGQNPHLKIVHCLSHPSDAWKGRRGHVDGATIIEEIPDYRDRVFFVCGPPALVSNLEATLGSLQIPPSQIKTEQFPGY
jgi:ferredoxin-NADP reductase